MEQEFIVGTFKRSTYQGQWICTDPEPKGSHVIVWEKGLLNGASLPVLGETYIVRIDKKTVKGTARIGTIVQLLSVVEMALLVSLRTVDWKRDFRGQPMVVGRYIETRYGRFEPVLYWVDEPRILFRPHEDVEFHELYGNRLLCTDETEVKRAMMALREPQPS